MRKTAALVSLTLLGFMAFGGCSGSGGHDEAIDSVIQAEQSFAGDIADQGLKAGFLANLAERSVIFRPGPTSAVAAYQGIDDSPGQLSWDPVLVDASAAADLAFTTGPWQFSPGGPGTEAKLFGDYVTVWMKDPDGTWKIAIDVGVPHDPSTDPPPGLTRRGYDRVASPFEPAATFEDVIDAEKDLWTKSSTMGFGPALSAIAAPDMVVLRFGLPPATGPGAALMLVREARASWEPSGGGVSQTGDLAYTFGVVVYKGNEGDSVVARAAYLRIWERLPSGVWNVVMDVTSPMPIQQEGGKQ